MHRLLVLLALTWLSGPVLAAPSAAEGAKLVQEKRCETCHNNKTLGDAKAIYLRKDRKVTSWAKLKSQVAACNSELDLQLFPEDEEHIAEHLNQTYYKFKKWRRGLGGPDLKLKPVLAALAALSLSPAALAAAPECPAPRAQSVESAQVTARAIEWAQAQEAAALRSGTPLPARLQAIAKGNGVKLPQNIRLVVVDEIPLPKEQPLAGAAAKLGLASSWAAGLTLGYAVIVAKGYEADARILSHELRHVAQYEACGGLPRFLGVHLADMLERGYRESRFEVDARAHERH